jgi:hypothetical protein
MNIQVLNQLKFTGKTLYGKIAISKQSTSNFRFANNKNTLLNLSCMVQQGSYKYNLSTMQLLPMATHSSESQIYCRILASMMLHSNEIKIINEMDQ